MTAAVSRSQPDIVEQIREMCACTLQGYHDPMICAVLREAADRIEELTRAMEAERERCALIAVSFGDFPGRPLIKDMRAMCGNAIADKIREAPVVPLERSGGAT